MIDELVNDYCILGDDGAVIFASYDHVLEFVEKIRQMERERKTLAELLSATPVDAVPGFIATEPRQSLSRMRPGDRFVLVRTSEIYHIKKDGSQWNETRQRPAKLHKNSQVRLIVDAVNMSQERVDEAAKCVHEWIGLTDKEKNELVDAFYGTDIQRLEAVEAKLKERNT